MTRISNKNVILAYFIFIYSMYSMILILILLVSIKMFKANKTLILIIKFAGL